MHTNKCGHEHTKISLLIVTLSCLKVVFLSKELCKGSLADCRLKMDEIVKRLKCTYSNNFTF